MNINLAKTNSWHWLAASLIVSLGIAAFFWTQTVTPAAEQARRRNEQTSLRLTGLRMLDETRIDASKEELQKWKERRAAATAAYEALKIDPVPSSAGSAFLLKNTIDKTLASLNLRVAANEIAVGVESSGRKNQARSSRTEEKMPTTWTEKPPYKTEEFKYSVVGSFRNMFIFLWLESARKSSYHLKDFSVKHTPEGLMMMDFMLQVSHK